MLLLSNNIVCKSMCFISKAANSVFFRKIEVLIRELVDGNCAIPASFLHAFQPNLHCFKLGEVIKR